MITLITQTFAAFAAWTWRNSWQAALVASAVLLVQAILGKRLGSGWRYGLWSLVAIRLLLPAAPASKTSVYNVVSPATVYAPMPVRTALGFQGDVEPAPAASAATPLPVLSAPPAVTPKPTIPAPRFDWKASLTLAWLAGAAWFLARLCIATRRLTNSIRRNGRAPSANLTLILREAAATLRMREPAVIETAAVDVPAVTGLLRPVVAIPVDLEDRFTRDEIRFLFLHELAHIRRGDLWTNLLARVLNALHWFNPLLWYASRRMRHDRESACDARVLGTQEPKSRDAYGHTLIKVLEGMQTAPRHAAAVGILEGNGQFRERLLRIAGYVKPSRFAMAGGLLLAATLAATLLTRAEDQAAIKPAASATPAPAVKQPPYSVRLLDAARAGDGPLIQKIINDSFTGAGFSEQDAGKLLDSLVQGRELKPFQTLLKELRQTNFGKEWQPSDNLLAGLVKDNRTDFLDALLAFSLDTKRLTALQKTASPDTVAWIERRVKETDKQRDDIHKLIAACKAGDLDTVRKLLDAGVDINGRELDGGWTPLTQAARESKAEVVKLLLARGAQVDLPKYPGWDYTPLCLTSSVEIANMLKAAGANVHANLFRRNTSILTYVAEFNGAPMVQWFIDQGLDPKMIGDNDKTLLFGVKDQATAEILIKAGVDPNRQNSFGDVPLQEARSAGVVDALVKGGAKFTGMKYPLLPSMMQFSKADAVEEVLKLGPKQDHETMQKALISALHMDQDEIVAVLIKYGANPNEPGLWTKDDPLMPLMVCTIFGNTKSAKVLLDHGADPNGGKTPGQYLENAIHNQHKDLALMLKKAGEKGVSDLAFAIAMDDKKGVADLVKSAPTFAANPDFWDDVLPSAAERGDLDLVKTAVGHGVPIIDKKSKADGYFSAAWQGQWEVLDYLLKQRDPKSDPEELSQALWGAVWNCNPYPEQRPPAAFEKTVQLLLAAGAPVKPKTGEGTKYGGLVPAAVFSRYPGSNAHVIEMLVAAGADPNPEVDKGKRLSDAMAEACKTNGCSTPNEEIVSTVERLAHVTIDRGQPK